MTEKIGLLYSKVSHVAYGDGYDIDDFKLTGRFANSSTDTQGLIGTVGTALVFAFRGSETTGAADWITDAKFIPKTFRYVKTPTLAVHAGFENSYQSVRETLVKAAKESPLQQIVCVGHSLGGALACLCALDIKVNLSTKIVSVYTYGSPKVGGVDFVKFYNQQVPDTHRYVNGADLVPAIPPDIPLLINYEHVGQLHHIGNTKGSAFSADAVQAHLPANYTKVLQTMG